MITLTPFERRLRDAIIARAVGAASPVTACQSYKELGEAVDPDHKSSYPMTKPPFRGMGAALGHVSMYEVEHGRPMISALVVEEATGHPSDGFPKLALHLRIAVPEDLRSEWAFSREQRDAAFDFWSSSDPSRFVDAALDRLVAEMATLKRRIERDRPSV